MRTLHAILLAAQMAPAPIAVASERAAPERHIVYLHGRIVQEQGPEAISPEHGRYRFDDIVAALAREGAVVHAPLREPGATLQQGADAAKAIVDELARRPRTSPWWALRRAPSSPRWSRTNEAKPTCATCCWPAATTG